MKFSAVILAGGESSRMGRDKAGLLFEGHTLLERQAELLRSLQPTELFLAGGNNNYSLHEPLLGVPALAGPADAPNRSGDRPKPGLRTAPLAGPRLDYQLLKDNFPGCGPLAGIESALTATNAPLLLVQPVDLPCMSRETLKWLLKQCGENAGAIPRLGRQIEPLAAVYPKSACVLLRESLTAQRNAAQAFARACVAQGWARWADVPPEHATSFTNCNTPQEWEALTRHA